MFHAKLFNCYIDGSSRSSLISPFKRPFIGENTQLAMFEMSGHETCSKPPAASKRQNLVQRCHAWHSIIRSRGWKDDVRIQNADLGRKSDRYGIPETNRRNHKISWWIVIFNCPCKKLPFEGKSPRQIQMLPQWKTKLQHAHGSAIRWHKILSS